GADEGQGGGAQGRGLGWGRDRQVHGPCRSPAVLSGGPAGCEACHPATLRGGWRPTRRIRRYRLARSVASRRAASATLPRAADKARAIKVRSKLSSASASATSVQSPAPPPPPLPGGGAPSCGTTRATSSAV